MIPSRRFTVSQEETNCMYMPLPHQVMKWNASCTQSLIHFPALSAAAAIRSYHVLKILKDYGYRNLLNNYLCYILLLLQHIINQISTAFNTVQIRFGSKQADNAHRCELKNTESSNDYCRNYSPRWAVHQ